MFKKLERTWSHSDINHIPKFRKEFPELRRVDSEELANRFRRLGLDFFKEEKKKVGFLLRLSMPFAFILMVIMFILSPLNYLITGSFNYDTTKHIKIINWFRAVKLL